MPSKAPVLLTVVTEQLSLKECRKFLERVLRTDGCLLVENDNPFMCVFLLMNGIYYVNYGTPGSVSRNQALILQCCLQTRKKMKFLSQSLAFSSD